MARKNPPRLLRSGLTGRVYVVTRYRVSQRPDGADLITATEKYDVTDEFRALARSFLTDSVNPSTTNPVRDGGEG